MGRTIQIVLQYCQDSSPASAMPKMAMVSCRCGRGGHMPPALRGLLPAAALGHRHSMALAAHPQGRGRRTHQPQLDQPGAEVAQHQREGRVSKGFQCAGTRLRFGNSFGELHGLQAATQGGCCCGSKRCRPCIRASQQRQLTLARAHLGGGEPSPRLHRHRAQLLQRKVARFACRPQLRCLFQGQQLVDARRQVWQAPNIRPHAQRPHLSPALDLRLHSGRQAAAALRFRLRHRLLCCCGASMQRWQGGTAAALTTCSRQGTLHAARRVMSATPYTTAAQAFRISYLRVVCGVGGNALRRRRGAPCNLLFRSPGHHAAHHLSKAIRSRMESTSDRTNEHMPQVRAAMPLRDLEELWKPHFSQMPATTERNTTGCQMFLKMWAAAREGGRRRAA